MRSRSILTVLRPALAALALAACQPRPATAPQASTAPRPTAADQRPINGVGYVLFNAVVTDRSRDLLVANVNRLIDAGATTIDIGMNSPGGSTDAAVAIANFLAQTHASRGVDFHAYDTGVVASSAAFIFLGAQRRYAGARSAFLFHAAGLLGQGLVTAQALREQADGLDAYERLVRAALKAHSRLTPSEITTYVRRTVVLSADDARRDGIVDAIAEFRPPQGTVLSVITNAPPAPPRPPPPASPG